MGTGAADGIHAEFGDFSDRNMRRCSAALLDGHVLLDCGPHIMNALESAGVDPGAITDVVLTHLHGDHFSPENVAKIAAAGERELHLWFREGGDVPAMEGCRLHPMPLFAACERDGYTFTGVPANHDPQTHPQHLFVEREGKKLYYGTDGAWMLYETVQYLQNKRCDAAVLDCTVGDYAGDYRMGEHNSIPMVRLMKASMLTLGIIREDSGVYLTHMAMCLHKGHEETAAACAGDGITVAYDGLSVSL